jgi:hypothetical protein
LSYKWTRISEEFNKDVKLASWEPNDFIASDGLWHQRMGKYFELQAEMYFYGRTTM